jgi:hypothetical protein
MSAIGTKRTSLVALHMSAFGGNADMTIASQNVRPKADFVPRGELQLGGRASVYSPDWMALSSRKRIAPSLLVSEITKRTRPWLEVSA